MPVQFKQYQKSFNNEIIVAIMSTNSIGRIYDMVKLRHATFRVIISIITNLEK